MVDVRQLLWCSSASLQPKQIPDACRRRNQQSKFCSVRSRAKTHHSLIGGSDVNFLSPADIERPEIRLTLFSVNRDDRAAISAPDRRKSTTTPRRRVVAADSRSQIIVKIAREISRLSIRREIHHPEIRFGIRLT